ncbi:MAG: hypothetical protein AB8G23_16400 [Myxococcota bacterium]
MARRHAPSVSLFPFMSVLACTIGVLTLLLAAMSVRAVGASSASRIAQEEASEKRAANRVIAEKNRETAARVRSRWAEVDEALEARGLESGLGPDEIDAWIDRGRRQERLYAALADAEAKLAKVERERGKIETTIEVLESRRETLPILIDPTGLAPHLKPWFIECDAGGATAYRASDGLEYFVPRESIEATGDFGRYLRRVRAMKGALIVLLVRPEGLATAQQANQVISAAGIRVARLPLPGSGELDWALIRRAEGAG